MINTIYSFCQETIDFKVNFNIVSVWHEIVQNNILTSYCSLNQNDL